MDMLNDIILFSSSFSGSARDKSSSISISILPSKKDASTFLNSVRTLFIKVVFPDAGMPSVSKIFMWVRGNCDFSLGVVFWVWASWHFCAPGRLLNLLLGHCNLHRLNCLLKSLLVYLCFQLRNLLLEPCYLSIGCIKLILQPANTLLDHHLEFLLKQIIVR